MHGQHPTVSVYVCVCVCVCVCAHFFAIHDYRARVFKLRKCMIDSFKSVWVCMCRCEGVGKRALSAISLCSKLKERVAQLDSENTVLTKAQVER